MRLFSKSIFLFYVFFGFPQMSIAEDSEHEIFEALEHYFSIRMSLEPSVSVTSAYEKLLMERDNGIKRIERIILEDKDAINARNKYGSTLLHEVTFKSSSLPGGSQLVVVLLNHGADVHARDNLGRTPLHLVGWGGVVEILLSYGADVNARNNKRETPLYTNIKHSINTSTVEIAVEEVSTLMENGGKVGTKLLGQKLDILSFGDQVSKGELEIYYTSSAEEIVKMLKQIRQLVKNETPSHLSEDILKALDARIAEKKREGSGGSGGTCSKGFE